MEFDSEVEWWFKLEKLSTTEYSTIFVVKKRKEGESLVMKCPTGKTHKARLNALRSINNEIAALKELKHEGIVPIFETFEIVDCSGSIIEVTNIGYPVFVMPYYSEGSLYKHGIIKGIMTRRKARDFLRWGFTTIEYMLSQSYYHRDVKLGNILRDGRGSYKLCDFGFACKSDKTYAEDPLGTPLYITPEMIRNAESNDTMDLWGLTVCAFVILYGKFPFDGHDVGTVFTKIRNLDYEIPENENDEFVKDFFDSVFVEEPERIKIPECLNHPVLTFLGAEEESIPELFSE